MVIYLGRKGDECRRSLEYFCIFRNFGTAIKNYGGAEGHKGVLNKELPVSTEGRRSRHRSREKLRWRVEIDCGEPFFPPPRSGTADSLVKEAIAKKWEDSLPYPANTPRCWESGGSAGADNRPDMVGFEEYECG